MARLKTRTRMVKFPVFYGYTILVEETTNLSKSAAKYEATKEFADQCDGEAATLESDKGGGFIFIKPRATLSIIAHEAWHAVKDMLDYFKVELDHECVAYHLGYLTQEIFNFLYRRGKKYAK